MLNPVSVAVHGLEASQRKQVEDLLANSGSVKLDDAAAEVLLEVGNLSALLQSSGRSGTVTVGLVTEPVEASALAELLERNYFDVLHQSEWERSRLERTVIRASAFGRRAAQSGSNGTIRCLEAVVGAAPIGIACWDKQGRYRHVNSALATMNGLAAEAHYGRTINEVLPGLPEQASAAVQRVLKTGQSITQELQGNTAAQPGVERTWSVSYYPIQGEGDLGGVAAIWEEITHRQDAEKEHQRFISVLGHDLRNPLSAVLMSGQVLRSRVGDREKVIVDRIKRSALRMQRMIRDLLDFARLRNGRGIQLRATPGDLIELLNTVITESKQTYPEGKVQVEAPASLQGTWDLERVGQLLSNLVGNAFGHGTPGEEVHVRLSEPSPDEVQIEIRNQGEPPDPDNLEQLFQPFRAGRAEGNRDSLGLGLFITRALAEAHGGRVVLRASQGQTTATVTLPRNTALAS